MVRVQLTIQLFVSGPTDDSEEAEKQRDARGARSTIWRPRNAICCATPSPATAG